MLYTCMHTHTRIYMCVFTGIYKDGNKCMQLFIYFFAHSVCNINALSFKLNHNELNIDNDKNVKLNR